MNPPTDRQKELIRANWQLVREKGLKDCGIDMLCRYSGRMFTQCQYQLFG